MTAPDRRAERKELERLEGDLEVIKATVGFSPSREWNVADMVARAALDLAERLLKERDGLAAAIEEVAPFVDEMKRRKAGGTP